MVKKRKRFFSWTGAATRRSRLGNRLMMVAIAVMVIGLIVAISRSLSVHDELTSWRAELETQAGNQTWPEWSAKWPDLPAPTRRVTVSREVRGPYAFAATHPRLLERIPCYCGCVSEGHSSVLQCFVSSYRADGTPVWTDHSYTCPLCLHIAREVMLMSTMGKRPEEIRTVIDDRYKHLAAHATHTTSPES